MHCTPRFHRFVCVISTVAIFFAQPSFATPPNAEAAPQEISPGSVDVILGTDGVMQGYVVSAQGVPAPEVPITLTATHGEQVTTVSDQKGRFGYRGLAGGTYQLETEHGVVVCRAWTATTAPPRAAATMLMVHDANIVRGQWSAPPEVNGAVGRMKRVMTNPFAVATIIGAAVAIPVAIHNANQDDSGS